MTIIVRILLVAGFCVATVGAAGFGKPTEELAWPLFGGGMVAIGLGGFLARSARAAAHEAGGEEGSWRRRLPADLATIRDLVVAIDEQKRELPPFELRERIDALLSREYFDLTSQNEEIAAELGFSDYARVWEGVATAERLLARTWSIATDGYVEEALEELPEARRQIEQAAEAAASL